MELSSRRMLWLLCALCAFGQFPAVAQKTCQLTSIVNVRDPQGKLVPGLHPASFQATLRGQPVKILSATLQSQPRVVLLLDVSGSINRDNHNFALARFAAGNFVTTSAVPHVALVLFSNRILATLRFDAQPKEMLQKLADLNDGQGYTAAFDSLMYSASLFDAPRPGDAVYFISDGGDNRSKFRSKDVEKHFQSEDIRLFSFILWQGGQSVEEQAGLYDLKHLAEVTGGSIANVKRDESAKGREWLKASLLRTYDTMKNFYQLEVELPSNADTRHQWELQVVDEHGKKRKDVEVTYARNLPGCTAESPQKK
jgi:hypothetical protein